MSSFMDQIIAPYLTSPLANSTKVSNSYNDDRITNPTHYYPYRDFSSRRSISFSYKTSCNDSIPIETSIADNVSNSSSNSISRKSQSSKKPVVGRKSVVAKKSTESIKAIGNNCKTNSVTVEKILKTINMTKYKHSFKKMDLEKFKELKEIDLNAIGITRPSEIRTFKEAIMKAKMDKYEF